MPPPGLPRALASASAPRSDFANLNADSGERIVVTYSGLPQGAGCFVPDVVAGSDAVQPTGAGDFGVAASGGQYAPGGNGSLLLARVSQHGCQRSRRRSRLCSRARPDRGTRQLRRGWRGAIGQRRRPSPCTRSWTPIQTPSKRAQFPTFLGLARPTPSRPPSLPGRMCSGPGFHRSDRATATDPIPRFAPCLAPNDCALDRRLLGQILPRHVRGYHASSLHRAGRFELPGGLHARLEPGRRRASLDRHVNYLTGNGWLAVSTRFRHEQCDHPAGRHPGQSRARYIPGHADGRRWTDRRAPNRTRHA